MEITAEVETGIRMSLHKKFDMYAKMIHGVATGKLRHIIVRGSPGIGKSFVADEILSTYTVKSQDQIPDPTPEYLPDLSGHDPQFSPIPAPISTTPTIHVNPPGKIRYNRSSGHVTPLAMYNDLYKYRGAGDVSVFDDCDAVFVNGQSLNILKAATDTRPDRKISWNSSSRLAEVSEYEYKGSIVILTNLNMRHPCYSAILDRVFYYDLALTPAEKIVRIKIIAENDYIADELDVHLAINWLLQNYERIESQLSIRTFIKLIELIQFSSSDWKTLAELLFLER